jgi:hypothetical protein
LRSLQIEITDENRGSIEEMDGPPAPGSLKSSLEGLKVAQLKEMCKAKGLKVSE